MWPQRLSEHGPSRDIMVIRSDIEYCRYEFDSSVGINPWLTVLIDGTGVILVSLLTVLVRPYLQPR